MNLIFSCSLTAVDFLLSLHKSWDDYGIYYFVNWYLTLLNAENTTIKKAVYVSAEYFGLENHEDFSNLVICFIFKFDFKNYCLQNLEQTLQILQ